MAITACKFSKIFRGRMPPYPLEQWAPTFFLLLAPYNHQKSFAAPRCNQKASDSNKINS